MRINQKQINKGWMRSMTDSQFEERVANIIKEICKEIKSINEQGFEIYY
jgi:hypothetical protein